MESSLKTNIFNSENNNMFDKTAAKENDFWTLGKLYKQDVESASFMTAYPTSFHNNRLFFNDKKYLTNDNAMPKEDHGESLSSICQCCWKRIAIACR